MLGKSDKHMLGAFLKIGRNDMFNNCINIEEKCGSKILLRTYVTENHYLRRDLINLDNSSLLTYKRNNSIMLFKINLIKRFSGISTVESNRATKESASSISEECSKSNLSIFKNPNVLIFFDKNEPETTGQKIYRYLDISGFLTRYNNRKEWILDLDPYTRLSTVMLTEYERKLMIFLKFHVYLLFVACIYLWYHAQVHFTMKPPCPKPYDYGHLNGKKRDFTWHGKLFFIYPKTRCKECRWLDIQCKKECFEKLKQEGHKFFINNGDPLSVPKSVLYPSHFH
ncbi:conserved Plasmodium protein, unknown function [Plasmodium malariae]|uniref:Uncharacterized protein n=1 Tax=Plasmodium malariae TaxID=5858 RepID=A0A1C3L171_PLAMA|nr:conserved Plasmodium protein, unknown function [Plasmodium malariae]